MALFTDTDLQPFRDLFADLACDQECTINRTTKTRDGVGSESEGTPQVIATVMVSVSEPAASRGDVFQVLASRFSSLGMWTIRFPYGQDVQERDDLTFTHSTKHLIVQEVLDPVSFPVSTNVLAKEATA